MSVAPRGQAAARRAIGTLAVALAAVGIASAARASAVLPAGGPPPPPSAAVAAQAALRELHFGVRLADVPVGEARNYLAVRLGGLPPTKFTITSLTALRSANGQPELAARVRDTGKLAVDLDGLNTASTAAAALFGARTAAAASWTNAVTLAWSGGMILGLAVIGAVTVAHFWRPRRPTTT